jgi:Zn-dependent protease with chaperone function
VSINNSQGSSPARAPVGSKAPESFFTAQKRNRRACWRITAVCYVAALILGLPLTLVITPLIYAVTLVVAEIVNHYSPLPPEFWNTVNGLAHALQAAGNAVFNQKPIDPTVLATAIAVMLVPGAVFSLVLWLGVRAMLHRGGVGGSLLALRAREADKNDLKELQLADAAEEMAIAAGLPAPKLLLIESGGSNAAAIGTSPEDAHLVISRSLVDDLSREQMQGVLAHLISSIGDGDLRIAFTIVSVFETCGLLLTLINAPFGREARSTIWHLLRYLFHPPAEEAARARDAEVIASLLTRNLGMQDDDIDRVFSDNRAGLIRKLLRFVLFPIFLTNAAVKLTLSVFLDAVLGPSLALLWRARRYLADASAVHLTRDPNGLAEALTTLSDSAQAMPGAAWSSHLFIVKPEGSGRMAFSRADFVAAQRGDPRAIARLRDLGMAEREQRKAAAQAEPKASLASSSMASFYPSVERRLKRLERLGARIQTKEDDHTGVVGRIILVFLEIFLGALLLLVGAVMLMMVAVFILLNLLFLTIWLLAIHAIFGYFGPA